jgi:hypothetical protein
MPGAIRPVVVFEGRSELEAQLARDILLSHTIPVLHQPSLTTGMFGTPTTTRVVVPEEYADAAVEALREEGLTAERHAPARGAAEFAEAARDKLPPELGRRYLWILGVVFIVFVLVQLLRRL